ncbi:hypothetical protein QBC39DRAFT_433120 [Podospora conica]|nr:hypothetical protein QBC39DRAFT_433120 [Schizothecium conicum]
MDCDDDDFNSGEGEHVSSDGDEEDEFGTWDDRDDVFGAPTCPNQGCSNSILHSSGSLSICLNCHSAKINDATISTPVAFPYRALVEDSELRLLIVWPASETDDSIRCSLIHGRLGTGIEYDAVSYTWADETGDDSPCKTVFIEGLPLPMRGGTRSGLCPTSTRTPKKVLIFPGEATDEESSGLCCLDELERFLSPVDKERAQRVWNSFQRTIFHLFSRRYFTRVWILQEIALAKEPVVIYGPGIVIPWKTIRTQIARFSKEPETDQPALSSEPKRHLLPSNTPRPRALTLDTGTARGLPDLLDVLDKARSSQARDPRDMVFALFGMIKSASRFGLAADYNQSVVEAYAKVTVLMAAQHGLLNLLARTIPKTQRRALASWVPDWSSPGWHPGDTTWPREPFWSNDYKYKYKKFASPDGSALMSLTKIPILARPDRYEMSCIGAWVCDLATLFHSRVTVQVFTHTAGAFYLHDLPDLELLYKALDLPLGGSLCCYLPVAPTKNTTYKDDEHFERELENSRTHANTRAYDLIEGRHKLHSNCELILSSGRDSFCFAGLCVLVPQTPLEPLGSLGQKYNYNPAGRESGLVDTMRSVLSQQLGSVVLRHRSPELAMLPRPNTPQAFDRSAAFAVKEVVDLFGDTQTQSRARGPITSNPRGTLRGLETWRKAWADRELRSFDDYLQTAEGKAEFQCLHLDDITWPGPDTDPVYFGFLFRRLDVDISLGALLGDEPMKYKRLTFKLEGTCAVARHWTSILGRRGQ